MMGDTAVAKNAMHVVKDVLNTANAALEGKRGRV